MCYVYPLVSFNVQNVGGNSAALVVADPEIRQTQLTEEDEFLLLACDGLFDVFTSQEVVNTVRAMMLKMPPDQIVNICPHSFYLLQTNIHTHLHTDPEDLRTCMMISK